MLAPEDERLEAEAEGCRALWVEVLKLYWVDVYAVRPQDGGEAHDDLHGDQRILERLCDRLGLDVHEVGKLMLENKASRARAV